MTEISPHNLLKCKYGKLTTYMRTSSHFDFLLFNPKNLFFYIILFILMVQRICLFSYLSKCFIIIVAYFINLWLLFNCCILPLRGSKILTYFSCVGPGDKLPLKIYATIKCHIKRCRLKNIHNVGMAWRKQWRQSRYRSRISRQTTTSVFTISLFVCRYEVCLTCRARETERLQLLELEWLATKPPQSFTF